MASNRANESGDPPGNDELLLADLRELHRVALYLIDDPVSASGLKVFALGSIALGLELLAGIISELEHVPARALNAMRLARHLWELEFELHYVTSDPDPRLDQVRAREAMVRLKLPRHYRGLKPRLDPDVKKMLLEFEREANARDESAKSRRAAGEGVAPSEWGSVPGRRDIAIAVDRKKEYVVHYETASWFSHPSIVAMDNCLSTTVDGRVQAQPGAHARSLDGMSASLARVAFARLANRVNWIVGPVSGVGGLAAFMTERGIGERAEL